MDLLAVCIKVDEHSLYLPCQPRAFLSTNLESLILQQQQVYLHSVPGTESKAGRQRLIGTHSEYEMNLSALYIHLLTCQCSLQSTEFAIDSEVLNYVTSAEFLLLPIFWHTDGTVVEIIFKVGHNLRDLRERLFQSAVTEDNTSSDNLPNIQHIFIGGEDIFYSLLQLACKVNQPDNKAIAQVKLSPSARRAR